MVLKRTTHMKTMKNIIRLCQYAWLTGPFLLVAAISLQMLQGFAPVMELWLTEKLIDQISVGVVQWIRQLLPWIGLLILLKISSALFTHMGNWFETSFREKLKMTLKQDIFIKVSQANLAQYESESFHNQLMRAVKGMEGVFGGFIFQIFRVIGTLVNIVGLCWIIVKLHWIVPIIIMLGSLPSILSQTKFNEYKYNTEVHQSKDYRLMNYYKGLLVNREAAMEIRIFGFGNYLIGRWKELMLDVSQKIVSIEIKHGIKLVLFKLISVVSFGISLVLLVYHLVNHQMSLGESIIVVFALVQLQEKWEWFVRWCGWIQEDYQRLIKDLFAFLDIDQIEYHALKETPSHAELTLNNVSFHYPGTSREVLRNIQLHVPAGEKLVIVGENGSGKTTLLKLIMGFYKPTSGRVLLNDWDISLYPDLMWSNSSILYQDFVKYELTLKDNIGFGYVSGMNNIERMKTAAKKGGADKVATVLQHEYNNYLGPQFGGADLSGGQWQMVATSRSFMRDGMILILDEPSAALDPLSESDLHQKVINIAEGKTTIVITHRLGIAKLADRIIVLKNGEIIEVGNHEHLMQRRGEYFLMWETQASLYQKEGMI